MTNTLQNRFSRTWIETGRGRLKIPSKSLLLLPLRDSVLSLNLKSLSALLDQCGRGVLLRLVRPAHKKSCSFLLGFLEQSFLVLSVWAVMKPKKPCKESHVERNKGNPRPPATTNNPAKLSVASQREQCDGMFSMTGLP